MNKGEIGEINKILSTEKEKMQMEVEAVRLETECLTMLRKINLDNMYNEITKTAMMYRMKKEKEYRKLGMTWPQFLSTIGESKTTVDEKLRDISPLIENFKELFNSLAGVPFSKIRYLGRSISEKSATIEDNSLVVDGVNIPLSPENKDDIEALIDELKETHKKEKQALSGKLEKEKKGRDRIIKAETETLHVEKDALVEEVKRLSAFEPNKKEDEWFVEKMDKIIKLAREFTTECHAFQADERVIDNDGLHNQIAGLIQQGKDAFKLLEVNYGSIFVPDFDEE